MLHTHADNSEKKSLRYNSKNHNDTKQARLCSHHVTVTGQIKIFIQTTIKMVPYNV